MKDSEILKELYGNKKWDALDSYIDQIIQSKNIKRYETLLETFQKQRNDKIFKYLLDDIETKLYDLKH